MPSEFTDEAALSVAEGRLVTPRTGKPAGPRGPIQGNLAPVTHAREAPAAPGLCFPCSHCCHARGELAVTCSLAPGARRDRDAEPVLNFARPAGRSRPRTILGQRRRRDMALD